MGPALAERPFCFPGDCAALGAEERRKYEIRPVGLVCRTALLAARSVYCIECDERLICVSVCAFIARAAIDVGIDMHAPTSTKFHAKSAAVVETRALMARSDPTFPK